MTSAGLTGAAPGRKLVAGRLASVSALDQILFGGATFAATILLARWLPPAEFGAFALAFFVFLLVGSVHTAVLTEPMLVFGAGRHRERFRSYLGLVLAGHAAVSAVFLVALVPSALALALWGSHRAADAVAGLAVACPAVLLLWLLRRAFYVSLEPKRAAAGDALYLLLALAALAGLARSGLLTPGTAFVALGVAALAVSAVFLALLRPTFRRRPGDPGTAEVLADHWRFGSWNVAAQALFWSSGQMLRVLVAILLGLPAVAAMAAASLLYRPVWPLMQSVTALLLPAASSLASSGAGQASLRGSTRRYLVVCTGGVLAYGLLVSAFAGPILHHLYGGKYDGYALLVLLFAFSNAASSAVQVLSVGLKATGNVRATAAIWAFSAAATLVLAVPAIRVAGLEGALAVLALSYAAAAVSAWRISRGPRPAEAVA